jgi:hypothetical protein
MATLRAQKFGPELASYMLPRSTDATAAVACIYGLGSSMLDVPGSSFPIPH